MDYFLIVDNKFRGSRMECKTYNNFKRLRPIENLREFIKLGVQADRYLNSSTSPLENCTSATRLIISASIRRNVTVEYHTINLQYSGTSQTTCPSTIKSLNYKRERDLGNRAPGLNAISRHGIWNRAEHHETNDGGVVMNRYGSTRSRVYQRKTLPGSHPRTRVTLYRPWHFYSQEVSFVLYTKSQHIVWNGRGLTVLVRAESSTSNWNANSVQTFISGRALPRNANGSALCRILFLVLWFHQEAF